MDGVLKGLVIQGEDTAVFQVGDGKTKCVLVSNEVGDNAMANGVVGALINDQCQEGQTLLVKTDIRENYCAHIRPYMYLGVSFCSWLPIFRIKYVLRPCTYNPPVSGISEGILAVTDSSMINFLFIG